MSIRVIKLGGSLLEWPEWPVRFRRWLAAQPQAANLLVVGGGPIVEGLRTLDRAHRLSVDSSHWLAIRGMSITARVAAELLPEATLIVRLDQLDHTPTEPSLQTEQGDRSRSGLGLTSSGLTSSSLTSSSLTVTPRPDLPRLAIVDVEPLLRAEQGRAAALPSGWDVTSDSIAARIAHLAGAAELVLLKSALPAVQADGTPQLAGYVDAYFPTAARNLPIRAVNLRDPNLPHLSWNPSR